MDTSGDGKVSKAEFIKALRKNKVMHVSHNALNNEYKCLTLCVASQRLHEQFGLDENKKIKHGTSGQKDFLELFDEIDTNQEDRAGISLEELLKYFGVVEVTQQESPSVDGQAEKAGFKPTEVDPEKSRFCDMDGCLVM